MNRLLINNAWLIALVISSCTAESDKHTENQMPKVSIAGAMKNVMWKGELHGIISLDTLQPKGYYGLGPLNYLKGELLLLDGKAYVSRVVNDSVMTVEVEADAQAPFFVYTQIANWKEVEVNQELTTIKEIEDWLNTNYSLTKEPFVFKLNGDAEEAHIHIQNLPDGSVVSSPKEAHEGQTNYILNNQEVEIIGFYSTKHHGIFTHHDSNIHLHLITADRSKMGHLDSVQLKNAKLFVAVNQN